MLAGMLPATACPSLTERWLVRYLPAPAVSPPLPPPAPTRTHTKKAHHWHPAPLPCTARHRMPIDMVGYDFQMLGTDPAALVDPPTEGVYIHGLFLEGCGWDARARQLCESRPKVLFTPAPCMWLRPKPSEQLGKGRCYSCPLYRTAERRGVLATTGHSTNFVMFVRMPTDVEPSHWVMRGVAMLSQLSE